MKDINADYYGYRDEDDGVLVPLELEKEQEGNKNNLPSVISFQSLGSGIALDHVECK